LMGRGGKQAYNTDAQTIQLAASTFFSDTHSGFDTGATPMWGDSGNQSSDHYYPCGLAPVSAPFLVLSTSSTDSPKNPTNFRLDRDTIGTKATTQDIQDSCIWMGLLVNAPAVISTTATTQRGNVSVNGNDTGLYLQNVPKSAKAFADATHQWNGANPPGGGYAWVVGKNGSVFGAYTPDAGLNWYNGFSGAYP